VAAVHLAAAKGVNTHVLAKRYGFVYQTLRRHLKLHLSESTRRMLAGDVYTDIDALLKRVSTGDAESIDLLNATIAGLFNLFQAAFQEGDRHGAALLSSRLEKCIELRSRISRELVPSASYQQTNIMVQGDISTLLRLLRPFPEALAAITNHYAQKQPALIEGKADAT
jgi:hypothetical protein